MIAKQLCTAGTLTVHKSSTVMNRVLKSVITVRQVCKYSTFLHRQRTAGGLKYPVQPVCYPKTRYFNRVS